VGGTEFRVSAAANLTSQQNPCVVALANGSFVVAYQSAANSGDILFNLVDSSNVVGSAVTANTTTTGAQTAPRIAALSNGSFALVWTDGATTDIRARVFTSGGSPGT
jgi:hypothetical protein